MGHYHVGEVPHGITERLDSLAQSDVVEIEEEALIEIAYLLKDFTADERERAWNPICRSGFEWIGPRLVRTPEETRLSIFGRKAGQCEGLVQRRGKLSH